MQPAEPDNPLKSLHAHHPRDWRDNLYVYPVISRRSRGLSIGINLSPDKLCSFQCVYCQVDRGGAAEAAAVDPERLREELRMTVREAVSGDLFGSRPFSSVPPSDRAVRDIAFSGDGEPTTSPVFPHAVRIAADVRQEFGLSATRIVLITNASCLDKAKVRQALEIMDANNGEIWAKLDAGTDDYYRRINRSHVPFERILLNILEAARIRPIVIQSLWMRVQGSPPRQSEVKAFAERLRYIIEGGGRIRLVQIYTVARPPAEPFVEALQENALDAIARTVQGATQLPVAVYT